MHMSPETPKPQSSTANPEMYVIPAVSTDALEQARIDAEEFKNTINTAENEAARTFIDVTDVPGYEERVEVRYDAASHAQRELGHKAVAYAKSSVPIEHPTPQVMKNSIGSQYYQDRLGRIVPKEGQE